MSKVLVIAAHPDDEILGVGATIRKHIKNKDECYAIVLGEGITSRYINEENRCNNQLIDLHENIYRAADIIGFKEIYTENLRDNRFDSYDLLDIVKIIENYILKIKPDIIYTHYYGDVNIDHKITFEATLVATRPIGLEFVKEIYCFETVSSTEWNFKSSSNFNPNYFVDITKFIDEKIEAVKQYKGELREYPHPRSVENLIYTAKKWGAVIGKGYAEAFEVVRIIK